MEGENELHVHERESNLANAPSKQQLYCQPIEEIHWCHSERLSNVFHSQVTCFQPKD